MSVKLSPSQQRVHDFANQLLTETQLAFPTPDVLMIEGIAVFVSAILLQIARSGKKAGAAIPFDDIVDGVVAEFCHAVKNKCNDPIARKVMYP